MEREWDLEYVDSNLTEIQAIHNRIVRKWNIDLSTSETRELAIKLYMNEQEWRRHNEAQGNLGTMYGGMMN